ncbi:MAG: alpha/beta fold hydrolase [Gammaproteobacteria bacterium]|jgi:pimeloyl-ACP methyl ester carboxylesterase
MHLLSRNCNYLICLGFYLLCQNVASANIEEIQLPNGYFASADYRIGQPELPTVVVLHGFLSTRNFLTVSNLLDALAGEGYTVLAPNLTLGVNHRKVSLACEAIHTHSIDDDIAEINYWVEWLVKRGHNNIVLVGHSYGSLHGLYYAMKYKHPAVKKLVAASLVDVEHIIGEELSKSQIEAAKELVANNDDSLSEYQVSYCKKYVAPAKAFLSYASWSRQRILTAISQTPIPVEVILGSEDKRMGEGWPQLLRQNGVTLQLIEGANHFFHNEQEFDLLDSVLHALQMVK